MVELFGIARRCPFGQAREGCPVAPIRRLPLKRRHDAITALSSHERSDILAEHARCTALREQAG